MPPIQPAITVTGTLYDIFGSIDAGSGVIFQLVNYGPFLPRIANSNLIAKCKPTAVLVDASGAFTQKVYGNDVIVPAGTYYTLSVQDDTQSRIQTQAYLFTGSGSIDISGLAPYQPISPPNAPVQYQFADLWIITLGGNPPPTPTPGAIYAPPGSAYTFSRTPATGGMMQLYYNGVLLIPTLHYSVIGRQISLTFQTALQDNLYAIYVATSTS